MCLFSFPEARPSQVDYKIGPDHMTFLPSLYGDSKMSPFQPSGHCSILPTEPRWEQAIVDRLSSELVEFAARSYI